MDKYITKIEKLVAERMNAHSKPTGKGLLAKSKSSIKDRDTMMSVDDNAMLPRIATYVHDIRMLRMALKNKTETM